MGARLQYPYCQGASGVAEITAYAPRVLSQPVSANVLLIETKQVRIEEEEVVLTGSSGISKAIEISSLESKVSSYQHETQNLKLETRNKEGVATSTITAK